MNVYLHFLHENDIFCCIFTFDNPKDEIGNYQVSPDLFY